MGKEIKTFVAPVLELPDDWGSYDSNAKVVIEQNGKSFHFFIDSYGELDDGIDPLYAEFLDTRYKKDEPKTLEEVHDHLVKHGVIAKDTVLKEHSTLVLH